jgi:hypothetical protein
MACRWTLNTLADCTQLPNNQYILTYTQSLLDATKGTYTDPVYYKIASSPENFGAALTQQIRTNTGSTPQGASFVTCSSMGGANGTVVLSDSRTSSLFINENHGDGAWTEIPSTAGRAVGREVRVRKCISRINRFSRLGLHALANNDATKLRIVSGSQLGQQQSSQVLLTVMSLAKYFGA